MRGEPEGCPLSNPFFFYPRCERSEDVSRLFIKGHDRCRSNPQYHAVPTIYSPETPSLHLNSHKDQAHAVH